MDLVLEIALDWVPLVWHSLWKSIATCSSECRQLAWRRTTERMVDFARYVVRNSTCALDSGRCHDACLPWPQELTCMWTQWYIQLGQAQLPPPWFRTVDQAGVKTWAVPVGKTVRFAGWSHKQNEPAGSCLPQKASGYYIWCQPSCMSQVVKLHDTLYELDGPLRLSVLLRASCREQAIYARMEKGVTLLPLDDLTALLFLPKSLVQTQNTHLLPWVQRRLQQPTEPTQPRATTRMLRFRNWVPVVPQYPACKPSARRLPYALDVALHAGVQLFLADTDLVHLGRTGWGGVFVAMRCWREKAAGTISTAVTRPVQGRSYSMPRNFPQTVGIQQFAAWYHRVTPPPTLAAGDLQCGQMYDVLDEYFCWHPAVVVALPVCAVTVRFCGWSSRVNQTIAMRRWTHYSAPYGSHSFVAGGQLRPNTYCLIPCGTRYGWAKVETLLRGRWKTRVTILVQRQYRRFHVWQDHAALGLLPLDDQTAVFSAKWMGGEPYWPASR